MEVIETYKTTDTGVIFSIDKFFEPGTYDTLTMGEVCSYGIRVESDYAAFTLNDLQEITKLIEEKKL